MSPPRNRMSITEIIAPEPDSDWSASEDDLLGKKLPSLKEERPPTMSHLSIRMSISKIISPEPDWSALPDELLGMIGDRVIKLKDVIRFRASCKPWRRATAALLTKFEKSNPWLMLPYCRSGNYCTDSAAMVGCKGTDSCRCFFDVREQEFHHIEVPGGLTNMTCRGSVFGWLLMTGRTPSLFLLNPLTGCTISLPPVTDFSDVLGFWPDKVRKEYMLVDKDGFRSAEGKRVIECNHIRRFALSAEPTSEECIMMVIRAPSDRLLAFCKPAGAATGSDENQNYRWTMIPRGSGNAGDLPIMLCFMDIVFWRGQFYALVDGGRVFVCDLSLPDRPRLSLFLGVPPDRRYGLGSFSSYLLINPADDELMMVTRHVEFDDGDDVGGGDDEWGNDDNVGGGGDDDNVGGGDDEWGNDDNVGGGDDEWGNDDSVGGGGGGGGGNGPPAIESEREVDGYAMDSDSDEDNNYGQSFNERQLLTTVLFRVFKAKEDRIGWDEVESIGDFALFLGFNSSVCISTRDHPEYAPNSIYFTDDLIEKHLRGRLAGADMGVYDLDTRTVRPFYCAKSVHDNSSFIWPLPVWVIPSNY